MQKFKKCSTSDKLFYIITAIILAVALILVLYPCIFVVSASFSSGKAVQSGKVIFWPVDVSLEGYKTILNTPNVWIGFRNSLIYTIAGTLLNVAMTMMAAYSLSRKDLVGRNGIMLLFTLTMFFSGGMIPTYMVVQRFRLLNTPLSLLLPGAISIYNLIVAKTFLSNTIPLELLEASQMDGCSDARYFFQIVLPLSKAIIAVLFLFYGVAHWNAYFSAMIYLNDKSLYPLTLFLREILMASQIDPATVSDPEMQARLAEMMGAIKYSLIVVSTVPVIMIYPFVQKYFVQGVMIGSVKG